MGGRPKIAPFKAVQASNAVRLSFSARDTIPWSLNRDSGWPAYSAKFKTREQAIKAAIDGGFGVLYDTDYVTVIWKRKGAVQITDQAFTDKHIQILRALDNEFAVKHGQTKKGLPSKLLWGLVDRGYVKFERRGRTPTFRLTEDGLALARSGKPA